MKAGFIKQIETGFNSGRARGTQGKAREGVPRAPWGPPGFPLGPPGWPWVPLASKKEKMRSTFNERRVNEALNFQGGLLD